MNINLYFTSFFIPKLYIKTILGILETLSVLVPIILALVLIVSYLSTKTNIKYYEKHPEQENSQIRLAEEQDNLKIFKYRLKKYIAIGIVFIIIAIGLEIVKRFVKF